MVSVYSIDWLLMMNILVVNVVVVSDVKLGVVVSVVSDSMMLMYMLLIMCDVCIWLSVVLMLSVLSFVLMLNVICMRLMCV